jgi:hypothetical protein
LVDYAMERDFDDVMEHDFAESGCSAECALAR